VGFGSSSIEVCFNKRLRILQLPDPGYIWQLTPERLNKVVYFEREFLVGLWVFQVIWVILWREVLVEFDSADITLLVELILEWRWVRDEVDSFLSCWIEDFIIRPQILKTSPERYWHSLSAKSERGPCAIQCGIPDSKNKHMAFQLWSLLWLIDIFRCFAHFWEEILWREKVFCLLCFSNAFWKNFIILDQIRVR
jgi:hypothetical protein